MRIRVHADDLGASRGVTDGILQSIDDGVVESTSILANGPAFDQAIAALAARPRVGVSVHLNLVEGRPVLPSKDVDLLVDGEGFLRSGFLSLWRTHALATAAARARLEAQVRAELRAQIDRVRGVLGRDVPLRLDSHQHLHHIPFVFRIVADLASALPGGRLRMVREPFFVDRRGWRRHSASGVAKHLMLNALGATQRRGLAARGLTADDWVVGVLLSGRMSPTAVDAALHRIEARAGAGGALTSVELFFHPGGAATGEDVTWARYPAFHAYYFSPWRRFELEGLRSPEMAACLQRWGHVTKPARSTRDS